MQFRSQLVGKVHWDWAIRWSAPAAVDKDAARVESQHIPRRNGLKGDQPVPHRSFEKIIPRQVKAFDGIDNRVGKSGAGKDRPRNLPSFQQEIRTVTARAECHREPSN